jgi:hypothetical protein
MPHRPKDIAGQNKVWSVPVPRMRLHLQTHIYFMPTFFKTALFFLSLRDNPFFKGRSTSVILQSSRKYQINTCIGEPKTPLLETLLFNDLK